LITFVYDNFLVPVILLQILYLPTYATFFAMKLTVVDIIIEITDSTEIVEAKLNPTLAAIVRYLCKK